MIRIELTDEILQNHRDYIYNESNIKTRLNALKRKRKIYQGKPKIKTLVDYLITQVELLGDDTKYTESVFLMTPEKMKSELEVIKRDYNEAFNECQSKNRSFSNAILDALGYENFAKRDPTDKSKKSFRPGESRKNWGAYAFLLKLDLSVCPYCNRAFINTIYMGKSKGRSRADLDHFLPKALYPYFSMSIYNLVPSCNTCNSSFKGQKPFNYKKNLNPYEHLDINALLTFGYTPENYIECIGLGKDQLNVTLNYNTEDEHGNKTQANRLEENCKTFQLEKIYQNHADVVKDILLKHHIFSQDYKKQVMNTYKGLFSSEDEVDRLLYGDIRESDIKDSILGKLHYDINNNIQEDVT